jgi:hypothetical protein
VIVLAAAGLAAKGQPSDVDAGPPVLVPSGHERSLRLAMRCYAAGSLLRQNWGMVASLRCADLDSACSSAAALYGVSADAILEALPRAAMAALADEGDPIRALPAALAADLDTNPRMPPVIHYFHGTRAADLRRFAAQGLRPLHAVLDDIWRAVATLGPEVSPGDVRTLRNDLEASRIHPHTYGLRVADGLQHGPCGHLVRDALLYHDDYDSVDYLGGAEIVVDICSAMGDKFAIDFLSRCRAATVPCIVEFTGPPQDSEGALASALWYIEAGQRGVATPNANWGFNGAGAGVPSDRIVAVRAWQG